MDSCHGNPSPSDPMESVCRHFPPPPQQLPCCIFTKSLANWLAAVRWILATATRLHRIRWSPFADIFHPLLSYYSNLAVYLLTLSRTVSRRSDGLLPRQPVSIGSDGVRLPTFSTPSSALPCRIFTKSLANCLAAVRWTLATATRLHRIRWCPFADIFHPLLSYTLPYIY